MLFLNPAVVVCVEEDTTILRGENVYVIPNPLNRHALELRIQNVERPHLPLKASSESVSLAAQRSAFSADVVVDAVGKSKIKGHGSRLSRHGLTPLAFGFSKTRPLVAEAEQEAPVL